MGTAPLTTAPAGTAPRKQLAAAAAAGAAAGANKSGGRAKAPYKKGVPGTGKRGGRGGGGRGGGRSGGSGGGGGEDDDGDDVGGNKGKDSDDDNDDDPEVSIEEQFILRLPPGEMCDRFREKVLAREVDESVKLRFSDPRRGTFTFEDIEFPTKLVDLPTIIEAQKTLNGKQMYKIADISQMLIVDLTPVEKVPEVKTEPSTLQPSDYVWPDGLTNPLKNVRKRRFRKRVSKVAVEGVENEIERLLQEDALAEEVVYEIREQIDGMDRFDSDDGATPAPEGGHSDMDMDAEMMDMDEEEEEEDEDEDDLLAELERKIGGGENSSDEEGEEDEEEEEDDDDDDDDDSGSEEDDEDDGESAQMEKLLKDEIRELNGKVKDTQEKLQSAPNDILKV
ncbi:TAFII55 protein conserved region-domain-containing protein [Dissophora ornata]|nr:TAFII55 protein conserved region-domain-containing protein [Dissophora ornata]